MKLASRLSYFFVELDARRAAAGCGRGRQVARAGRAAREQLKRMLADPKIARFTESFTQQWLQLYRVGMFPPDPKLYPDYDKWLEQSMAMEPEQFFSEVFGKNLPLKEFLTSDWTMVNPRLARHYGLPPLNESGFQRVTLRPEDHRGGLLTQAAVLMLTSDGTRHRPVHRGVWVSEAVFNRTPPPPPPNVEPLEPTPNNQPKATIACSWNRTRRTRSALRAIRRSIRSASPSTITTRSVAGAPKRRWRPAKEPIRR